MKVTDLDLFLEAMGRSYLPARGRACLLALAFVAITQALLGLMLAASAAWQQLVLTIMAGGDRSRAGRRGRSVAQPVPIAALVRRNHACDRLDRGGARAAGGPL